MKSTDIIIGIDPDCEKSGWAVISDNTLIEAVCCSFPVLIDKLIEKRTNRQVTVVVEAGWLNKSNFHMSAKDSRFKAAAMGNAVGRNHETGRKIVEMCEHMGIKVYEKAPLRKIWKGNDKKITHEQLAYFVKGLPSRTNQEIRDAVLIAWDYAGLPIRVKSTDIKY